MAVSNIALPFRQQLNLGTSARTPNDGTGSDLVVRFDRPPQSPSDLTERTWLHRTEQPHLVPTVGRSQLPGGTVEAPAQDADHYRCQDERAGHEPGGRR